MNEIERREQALAAQGGDVEPGAREVPAREVMQMLSVRVEPELIAGLREVAQSRNEKVSDLIREAAARVVHEYRAQEITLRAWSVPTTTQIAPVVTFSLWNADHAIRNSDAYSGLRAS